MEVERQVDRGWKIHEYEEKVCSGKDWNGGVSRRRTPWVCCVLSTGAHCSMRYKCEATTNRKQVHDLTHDTELFRKPHAYDMPSIFN